MQVVHRQAGASRDVDVAVRHPAATVGDLAAALGAPGAGLAVDGRPCGPDLALLEAGLQQGSVVEVDDGRPVARPAAEGPMAYELAVTGGLVAGPSFPLPPGTTTVGRAPGADVVVDAPTVSAEHVRLTVDGAGPIRVEDLESHNGTWVDDVAVTEPAAVAPGTRLRLGAVQVTVGPVTVDDRAPQVDPVRDVGPGGRVPFNRPPRPAAPAPPRPLVPPAAPAAPPGRTPFSLVAFLAPLGFAAVMVLVLKDIRFALFALLSPVLVAGSWVESRRRHRKGKKQGARELEAELARFREELRARRAEEVDRRWAANPSPAEARRRAGAPSVRLWERRPDADDFLALHGGTGDVPWCPALADERRDLPAEVQALLEAEGVLPGAPVAVDLSDGGVVGLVGDRDAALAVARSLLCQAATHSGPADLRIAVLTEPGRVEAWDWAKWLPHAGDPGGAGEARLLAGDPAASDALLRGLLAGGRRREGPVTLVVLDAEALTEGRNAPARAVLRGEGGPVAGIVIAEAEHRLPAMTTTVIELRGPDGDAALRRPQLGEVLDRFLAAGVTDRAARDWARALARFDDPEIAGTGTGLPAAVDLAPLLDVDAFDPAAVLAGWRAAGSDPPPAAPLGVSDDGVFVLDLSRVGPHGLVAGTTGAGKSELLRAFVAGLAVRCSPEQVSFLLVDYKGGAAFDACADLPHTAGVVTDLDDRSAERALASIDQEVRHRERLLRAAGAADLAAYRAGGEVEPLPRLLIVVDELATLVADLPDFVDTLVNVTQRGRSLGLHLLLATQRPAGTVTANIRANTNLRIALRVQDPADSQDVVGTNEAATLPRSAPGRALVRLGPAEVVPVQTARVTGHTPGPGHVVDVAPFGFGRTSRAEEAAQGGPSDLARIVDAAVEAMAGSGFRRPRRLWSDDAPAEVPVHSVGLPELLGLPSIDALDPETAWDPPRSGRDALRVPIGMDDAGRPLHLDLKEPALDGMGPHGLVVGATGSGKSELLRTLVVALTMTHPPEQLAFVLVDFKGGATFAGLAELPHVAGMITNLESDLALVDRMHDALYGEQRRRQEALRAAGNLASVTEYAVRRAAGAADLEPLPSLLVIVDEFAELLTAKPDFIDLFVSIGRLGRSLGMHLLLASQRLEEGRLRGLESHLSYRIGLRTFSAIESRSVLGVPDAYSLPPEPGSAFLKVDTTVFTRFKAAYVSGSTGVLEAAVARLRDAAPRAHQVWLPPLPPAIPLGSLVPDFATWPGRGRLVVPLGAVDRPEEQAQVLLAADLSGPEGNVAVVGAPQTGKSTLLRTLVCSLALTHTPSQVAVYGVDHGGGGLGVLEGLPHVGSVASRLEPERVRRVVAEVARVLDERERLFAAEGIDSAATFRARGLGPDVFLVIDGWPSLRALSEDVEATVVDVAARGLGYGVHVVATANRWIDIRANLRDSLGSRFELRLQDPADSSVDRRTAMNVPVGVPGRGLTSSKLHFQAALPVLDDGGVESLVSGVASAWPGAPVPPVRLLPSLLAASSLPDPLVVPGRQAVPIGVGETDLAPVLLDLTAGDPHFLVFGDGESGKTTFLRTFLSGLCRLHGPGEARVLVIDYRRTLLEVVPEEHLLVYAGAAPAASDGITRLRHNLVERLPGPELSAAALRDRSWWTGPEAYVVVDDYDLVVTPAGNPLAPLLELLPQARDIGLHLVIARRVAGASRALFEPVLQRVKELGTPGLILSGDRGEGALLGTVKASEQPPGRGLLVRRRDAPLLVQVATTEA